MQRIRNFCSSFDFFPISTNSQSALALPQQNSALAHFGDPPLRPERILPNHGGAQLESLSLHLWLLEATYVWMILKSIFNVLTVMTDACGTAPGNFLPELEIFS